MITAEAPTSLNGAGGAGKTLPALGKSCLPFFLEAVDGKALPAAPKPRRTGSQIKCHDFQAVAAQAEPTAKKVGVARKSGMFPATCALLNPRPSPMPDGLQYGLNQGFVLNHDFC